MKNNDIDPRMVIVVHPNRLKETAQWIVDNLEPHEYPGVNHFAEDDATMLEYLTTEGWQEIAWFDHADTVVTNGRKSSSFGHIEGQRMPRRHHLVFSDEHAWVMLRLLQ